MDITIYTITHYIMLQDTNYSNYRNYMVFALVSVHFYSAPLYMGVRHRPCIPTLIIRFGNQKIYNKTTIFLRVYCIALHDDSRRYCIIVIVFQLRFLFHFRQITKRTILHYCTICIIFFYLSAYTYILYIGVEEQPYIYIMRDGGIRH